MTRDIRYWDAGPTLIAYINDVAECVRCGSLVLNTGQHDQVCWERSHD